MVEKYFYDLNVGDWVGRLILVDIDGTVANDGATVMGQKDLNKLRTLVVQNEVYLCSNKKESDRNRSMARQAGVKYLDSPWRKPSRRVLSNIDNVDYKKILVIGDKFLTDGLFAKNIGAEFIKVKRLRGDGEGLLNKLVFWLDDIVYKFYGLF